MDVFAPAGHLGMSRNMLGITTRALRKLFWGSSRESLAMLPNTLKISKKNPAQKVITVNV